MNAQLEGMTRGQRISSAPKPRHRIPLEIGNSYTARIMVKINTDSQKVGSSDSEYSADSKLRFPTRKSEEEKERQAVRGGWQ